MYKNVGKEIKSWVTMHTILYALSFGIVGVVLGTLLQDSNAMIVLGVVTAVIGYLVGRYKAMKEYAYGELVENSDRIVKLLEQISTDMKTHD